MKQNNNQSDLMSMSSSAGLSYLTVRSFVYIILILRSLYFQSLQSLLNWIQLDTSWTSPVCTSFQLLNNKSILPSVAAFSFLCQFQLKLSVTVERSAKTLHRMSPCTPMSFSPKSSGEKTPEKQHQHHFNQGYIELTEIYYQIIKKF